MSEILKQGDKFPQEFKATCHTCGSVTKFDKSEVRITFDGLRGYGYWVKCPNEECGMTLKGSLIAAYRIDNTPWTARDVLYAAIAALALLGFAGLLAFIARWQ